MIKFRAIRYKNILSTGNVFTEIQLDRSPTTMILGENGAGKSTILDALTFVLFNKPFRSINKPNLVNSINKKDMLVEIEFTVGNKTYEVRRGHKPNVFEIYKDGKLIDQPGATRDYQLILEEQILKLNYKSFTQIVVLGNASFTPFMQLSVKDRREVIEDLLDIQIFSHMNLLLKDRVSENKQMLENTSAKLELEQERLALQKQFLAEFEQDLENQKKELIEEATKYAEQKGECKTRIEEINTEINNLLKDTDDKTAIENKYDQAHSILVKLEAKISSNEEMRDFLQDNDTCPTCKQVIDLEFKGESIGWAEQTIKETEEGAGALRSKLKSMKESIDAIIAVQKKVMVKQGEVRELEQKMFFLKQQIQSLKGKVQKLKAKKSESVDENKIGQIEDEISGIEGVKEELLKTKELYEHAARLLKDDGIKSKIIKQYVPIMNRLINKYLAALDFFVNFELDESFNEVLRSRYRDEFSYASFSEGEKLRIDLALLFTWRAVAKLKNSINTNLLILDEVFDASLDTAGCEEFLKLLSETSNETNVFVISHKGDLLSDKFRSQIKFEKHQNFSKIV